MSNNLDFNDYTISLKEHILTLVEKEKLFQEERDRRYAEVTLEREKAIKIKEQADREALELARQIQTYKDEKANELREQISRERGNYATQPEVKALSEKFGKEIANLGEKFELALKPISTFIAAQQGKSSGLNFGWVTLGQIATLIGVIIAIVLAFNK